MAKGWHITLDKKKERVINKINLIIDSNSCWNWTGSIRNKGGYGSYKWNRQDWLAHRLIWHLFVEPLTDPEIKLLHKCDNVLCVRPLHLFTGTQLDNIQDMVNKGRARSNKGSASGMAKLTEEKVDEIYKLSELGLTQTKIGTNFGVSHATIGRILRGNTWKHVKKEAIGKVN